MCLVECRYSFLYNYCSVGSTDCAGPNACKFLRAKDIFPTRVILGYIVIRSSHDRNLLPLSTVSFTTYPADNHLRELNYTSLSGYYDRGKTRILSLPRS